MADIPPAALRLRLDRSALADNWTALDTMSGGASAGAAVKADAYGLGVEHAVPALLGAGAREFFVAHWSEVVSVARFVAPGSISVLHGPGSGAEAAYARILGVMPVINSLAQARIWLENGGGPCHLMVDTGINRLGLSLHELGDPVLASLDIDMLMSHLASADEDSDLNRLQLERFRGVVALVAHRRRSLANSAGIALGSQYHFDATRPGLSLYGGIPRGELDGAIRQVAYPQAAVLQRRTIAPGDSVGYNATFTAARETELAVVSLGYADGFLRPRGPGGWFEWEGIRLPILGKVSMDMIVVDAGAAPEIREGDWLEVPFSLPEISASSGISQYELLTTLGHRFERTAI
ncbi:alanine racemase [Parerythrobacter lacustris]|uniref:alanine racemase n=1 Tax=Parerythrobacter lacustris TaxID=2969984 RepID=A0ABT1XT58_9SPHN|nr:alanine racemase [Parerythrobacter lacustris]MCR2833850.1 alanine racemase [Parerythrobacter lacustris]